MPVKKSINSVILFQTNGQKIQRMSNKKQVKSL